MGSKFSTLWFDVLLFGLGLVICVQGARMVLARKIETPFLSARGMRAVLIGSVVAAVGVAGMAVAAMDLARMRAGS